MLTDDMLLADEKTYNLAIICYFTWKNYRRAKI